MVLGDILRYDALAVALLLCVRKMLRRRRRGLLTLLKMTRIIELSNEQADIGSSHNSTQPFLVEYYPGQKYEEVPKVFQLCLNNLPYSSSYVQNDSVVMKLSPTIYSFLLSF